MISEFSGALYAKLTRSMQLTEKQYTAGLYGMNGAIYTALSTAVLVLFGSMFGDLSSTCIIIAVYYLNQTVGGGFHATTHTKCLMTMLGGLATGIVILKYCCWSVVKTVALTSAAFFLMWFVPLVLHKNKRFLETQKQTLIRKSRMCLFSEIILFLIMVANQYELSKAFAVGVSLAAVSRVVGKIINKRNI